MTASAGIILLRPDDTDRAAVLHSACFDGHGRWDARAMRDILSLPTTLALGIESEEASSGALSGLLLVQRVPPDAEILTICVDPAHRRQGFAQSLLDHARTLLGPHGVDRLLLDVDAGNEGAISFYERNGFNRDGVRKNYYQHGGGRSSDAVLMSRNLAGQMTKSKA